MKFDFIMKTELETIVILLAITLRACQPGSDNELYSEVQFGKVFALCSSIAKFVMPP